MNILAVDDERLALMGLVDAIKKSAPGSKVDDFRYPDDALESMKDKQYDIAFIDIEMTDMNGVELGRRLKERNPRINIIFTTGYRQYMEEAFAMHASGYLLKPVTPDKVKQELDELRFVSGRPGHQGLYFRTFGEFEVFYDGVPLRFNYAKSKEMLAVLIDEKGSMCSNGKLSEILWPDELKDHDSYIRNIKADIVKVLGSIGMDSVIIRRRGMIGLDMTRVSCDYINYLKGTATEDESYAGRYMSQYSWGEMTLAALEKSRL